MFILLNKKNTSLSVWSSSSSFSSFSSLPSSSSSLSLLSYTLVTIHICVSLCLSLGRTRLYSHVRSFSQISSNFLSLISSYPLLLCFSDVFPLTFISVTYRVGPHQNVEINLPQVFIFFIPEVKQYVVYGSGLDRDKQQDSTPQNDSTLGLNG